MRKFLSVSLSLILLGAVAFSGATFSGVARAQTLDKFVYLPLVSRAVDGTTGSTYTTGLAYQWDIDNPVRRAHLHADKNITLRGYVDVTGQTGFTPGYLDYGTDDTKGPQLPYLFNPARIPAANSLKFYKVRGWNWAGPPEPGTPGPTLDTCPPNSNPHCVNWPITGLGIPTSTGELIHLPQTHTSNPIAPGYTAIVFYADSDGIAVKYTNADSVLPNGYALHIRGIAVDPNLLNLYNQSNADPGPRYNFCGGNGNCSYPMPYLAPNQPIGRARGAYIFVAITDTGTFMDPRSCKEWWINFTGGSGQPGCVVPNGSTIR